MRKRHDSVRDKTIVGAAEFKARRLEGKPSTPFVGSMTGSVLAFDRPFDPVPGVWMSTTMGNAARHARLDLDRRW
jgi:hypothetical protein